MIEREGREDGALPRPACGRAQPAGPGLLVREEKMAASTMGGGGPVLVRATVGWFYWSLSLKPAHNVRPMPGFMPSARSAM
jgi:hypothetical protein